MKEVLGNYFGDVSEQQMRTRYGFYEHDVDSMHHVNYKRHTKASRMSKRYVTEKIDNEK